MSKERGNIISFQTGWFLNQVASVGLITILIVCSSGYGEASLSSAGDKFSFAIMADPHLNGNADRRAKFEDAIDWVIKEKDINDIELVFVLGDIAWGGDKRNRNLPIAKAILDRLNNAGIPYIPIIGDNEVQVRCEKEFQDVFEPQYRYLSKILQNWRKASVPVDGMYLQNFSFDYKSCHFVCLDFNSRKDGVESGELHDFPGGSWPWFKNDIERCQKAKKENIIIMTHIGMFRTGFSMADQYLFSEGQMKKIKQFLFNYREYVDSNYAGHIHQNWHAVVWSGLFMPIYNVRTTDETWYDTKWPESNDKELTIRLVQANCSGPKIVYNQRILDIDGNISAQKNN
jgi:hypothetical protein